MSSKAEIPDIIDVSVSTQKSPMALKKKGHNLLNKSQSNVGRKNLPPQEPEPKNQFQSKKSSINQTHYRKHPVRNNLTETNQSKST